MSCVLYGYVGEPDYFEIGDKCKNSLDPSPECGCLESQITSILGYPGMPAANWGGGCYLWYEYDVSDICPAYENGADFNYTGHCSSLCSLWAGGNPCDPYDGEKSMSVGDFDEDKENLGDKHAQEAVDKYYSDIAPIENKYEPDMCLVALEAECAQLNNSTPCIVSGCCAPWIIQQQDGTKQVTTNSSLKCLSCQHTQSLPKFTFKKIKDPDFTPPVPPPPGCATTTTTTTGTTTPGGGGGGSSPPSNDCDGAGG